MTRRSLACCGPRALLGEAVYRPAYFFRSSFAIKKHQKLLKKKFITTIGFEFLAIILLVKKI